MICSDCHGTRAVPDDLTSGYAPCPGHVIAARETFVCLETEEDAEPET